MHHLPLLQLLHVLLGRFPDVTIRSGSSTLGIAEIAEIEFATRVITLRPDLTLGQLHAALTHELVHLIRGPAKVGVEHLEEIAVHEEVARLLAPRHRLPAILEAADPHQVAHDLVIDPYTARLAISLARDGSEAAA